MSVLLPRRRHAEPITHPLDVTDAGTPPRERSWRRWNLLGLTALTAYSTGLGWQAQQVSYPLFRRVETADFLAYHQAYNEAIPWVVIVPGFVTFLASAAFWWTRPQGTPRVAAGLVVGTGVVSLLSTAAWAIPMHDRLDRIGQDAATIDSLLQANLIRSLALSLGTGALLWCIHRSPVGRAEP